MPNIEPNDPYIIDPYAELNTMNDSEVDYRLVPPQRIACYTTREINMATLPATSPEFICRLTSILVGPVVIGVVVKIVFFGI